MNNSRALWKIPTKNSVGDSLCNWHDEQCSQFTNEFTDGFSCICDRIYRRIPLVKMTCHHFFLLCFNLFSHGNSLGIYRGNIYVGKIPRKITDGNILSVFPFVFINFLVVKLGRRTCLQRIYKQMQWLWQCLVLVVRAGGTIHQQASFEVFVIVP